MFHKMKIERMQMVQMLFSHNHLLPTNKDKMSQRMWMRNLTNRLILPMEADLMRRDS